jgi:HEAT repeat protein
MLNSTPSPQNGSQEPHTRHAPSVNRELLKNEKRIAAKWPPDDANLPDGPPPPPYGGGSSDDGNFKRGSTKPMIAIVAILLVIGGGILAFFAVKNESGKLTVDQIAKERHDLALLPRAEQLPKWREWAARNDVPLLQQDAFAELAWAKDPAGVTAAINGLASDDHRIRGTAAQTLLEYASRTGPSPADSAKPALMKALGEADASDKPQISWALAALREPAAFDTVMAEYREGHLTKVQRLDGNPAFDPEVLAAMVPIEKFSTLVGDPSESVRQLVATILARTGDPKWTEQLIKLVQDPQVEVAREAAVGLGKIANEAAMGPLLAALQKADRESRQKFLEALRDGVGAKGLVLALKSVSNESPEHQKFQTKVIFDMLKDLEDPRGADALVAYIATNPPPHWKTEAALRLAEIGDIRAVPTLAWRLEQDPLTLYNKVDDPELMRDDNERVVSARMLADLAVLYPQKHAEMRAEAEKAAMFWALDKPQPHANVLRFLVAAESQEILPKLLAWSDPNLPLPEPGAQPPIPMAWETTQSALRYLGWSKDPQGWSILEKQLNRQGKKKYDMTMAGLQQGGLAVIGMTLRALAYGAADGFAQWGDSKAYPELGKYIEDKENNEQSRIEACFALSWVASDDQMKEVVKKVHDFNKPEPASSLIRSCYLETLIHRPVPEATAGLLDLIKPEIDLDVRHQAARAIGFGGITKAMLPAIQEKLTSPETRTDAELALLLGGDADTVSHAIAMYNDAQPEAMEDLKNVYNATFGYWSDRNYENGDVARWIENANAVRHVKVHDTLQDWPTLIVSRGLQGIEFDNGPHSITRVQLRVRLMNDARGSNDARRANAIDILKFMKEKGVLMALKSEQGPYAELARQAFFDVMNPKAVSEKIPDAAEAKAKTN